ncbi:MAG: hypothetical protein ACWA5P_07460 [bacterium]
MYHKSTLLLLFFSLFIITACDNDDNNTVDCSNFLPEPDWFELGFFNTNGNPLIGTVYTQDSFRFFNANEELFLSPVPFSDLTRLQVNFEDISTDIEYYIELTDIDTDTLSFSFTSEQGPCSIIYDLTQVIYNGEVISLPNPDQVDLIK